MDDFPRRSSSIYPEIRQVSTSKAVANHTQEAANPIIPSTNLYRRKSTASSYISGISRPSPQAPLHQSTSAAKAQLSQQTSNPPPYGLVVRQTMLENGAVRWSRQVVARRSKG